MYSILTSIQSGTTRLTPLLYATNLSYRQFKSYEQNVLARNLVAKKPVKKARGIGRHRKTRVAIHYAVTPKGFAYISEMDKLLTVLGESWKPQK